MSVPIQWSFDGPFSFDHTCYHASVTYPVHIHNGFEIYWFLQGDVEYHIEGARYQLEPGDLLLIHGSEFHRAVVTPGRPYERVTIHFTREFLSGFECSSYDLLQCFEYVQAHHVNRIPAAQAQKSGLTSLVQSLGSLDASPLPQREILIKVSLVRLLLAVNAFQAQPIASAELRDERIDGLLRYINSHLAEPLTLDLLADRFYWNKYYLCHRFKEVTGVTLTDYIRHKRVYQAYTMIQSGIPASQAARDCGFADYSHFYRSFRKCIGTSPSSVSRLWEHSVPLATSS